MSLWIINKKQSGYHTIKRNEGYLPMVADVYGTDAVAPTWAAPRWRTGARLTPSLRLPVKQSPKPNPKEVSDASL